VEIERESVLGAIRENVEAFEAERERHDATISELRDGWLTLLTRGATAGIGVKALAKRRIRAARGSSVRSKH
jgi:hypothetical protein